MNTKSNNHINKLMLSCLMLLTTFILGCGCNTFKPVPDPLAGWKILYSKDYENLDMAIINDYKDYINRLPTEEKNGVGPVQFFEDGIGQHAVKIGIALNGVDWDHVLIYGKDNRRIRTIKYATGHYMS